MGRARKWVGRGRGADWECCFWFGFGGRDGRLLEGPSRLGRSRCRFELVDIVIAAPGEKSVPLEQWDTKSLVTMYGNQG